MHLLLCFVLMLQLVQLCYPFAVRGGVLCRVWRPTTITTTNLLSTTPTAGGRPTPNDDNDDPRCPPIDGNQSDNTNMPETLMRAASVGMGTQTPLGALKMSLER